MSQVVEFQPGVRAPSPAGWGIRPRTSGSADHMGTHWVKAAEKPSLSVLAPATWPQLTGTPWISTSYVSRTSHQTINWAHYWHLLLSWWIVEASAIPTFTALIPYLKPNSREIATSNIRISAAYEFFQFCMRSNNLVLVSCRLWPRKNVLY